IFNIALENDSKDLDISVESLDVRNTISPKTPSKRTLFSVALESEKISNEGFLDIIKSIFKKKDRSETKVKKEDVSEEETISLSKLTELLDASNNLRSTIEIEETITIPAGVSRELLN